MTKQSNKWKSYVLQFFDDDDGCNVCRFLNGDTSTEVLLGVIRVLDGELARCMDVEARLVEKLGDVE